MEYQANIYQIGDGLLVTAVHRTSAGFYIESGKILRIEKPSVFSLGAAIRQAWTESQENYAVPERATFSNLMKSRLAAAGVRTEAAFLRIASLVTARIVGEQEFIPHKNGGSTGESKGFSALNDRTLRIPTSSDKAETGATCMAALKACC